MAGAKLFGLFGKLLAHGIAQPGGHVGAGAGLNANHRAQGAAPNQGPGVFFQQAPHARKNIADFFGSDQMWWVHVGDVAQQLRDGKHAHHHGDQLHAAHQLFHAKGKARHASWVLQANASDQQAQQQGDACLEHTGVANEHRTRQAQNHQPKILEGRKFQRNFGQSGREQNHHQGAKQTANGRENQACPQGCFSLALEGHLVGLIGIGR